MPASKPCFKCKKVKNLSEFYRHQGMADGYLNKCKECTKIDVTANRNAKIDYYRAKDVERAKAPERLKAMAALTKRWRAEDRMRSRAHNAVARAIRAGTLERQPCEECGRGDTHGHHDDYSKPLSVRWLCPACHSAHHQEKCP